MSQDGKDNEKKNPHAVALSALGAAKGGEERARRLSPEKRSAIAKVASMTRWGPAPLAICGSTDQPLKIGNIEIPCYVLEDGRRVLSQRGLQAGIGMSTSGGTGGAHRMARLVGSLGAKGIETKDLASRIDNPILFKPTGATPKAYGYEATILPEICEVVLEARKRGLLQVQQEHLGVQAEILVRGFARVGIIALVDEATGYQDLRARLALAEILEAFIAKELRPYLKMFPAEFYREVYRLRKWRYPRVSNRRTPLLGHVTNDIVYDRLAPGVRVELHKLTPRNEKGKLTKKLFQWLTEEIGDPRLREHLAKSVLLMKASEDWPEFMKLIDRALPKFPDSPVGDSSDEG